MSGPGLRQQGDLVRIIIVIIRVSGDIFQGLHFAGMVYAYSLLSMRVHGVFAQVYLHSEPKKRVLSMGFMHVPTTGTSFRVGQ